MNFELHPQIPCDAEGCCPPPGICIDGLCWLPVIGDGGDPGDTDDDGDGDGG